MESILQSRFDLNLILISIFLTQRERNQPTGLFSSAGNAAECKVLRRGHHLLHTKQDPFHCTKQTNQFRVPFFCLPSSFLTLLSGTIKLQVGEGIIPQLRIECNAFLGPTIQLDSEVSSQSRVGRVTFTLSHPSQM